MSFYTRKQYMADPCHSADGDRKAAAAAAHRRYYAQLVNARTIAYVVSIIGADKLRASTDEHLNDIPLRKWDNLTSGLPLATSFANLEDYATLGGLVCVAKEAAHQWIEANK
ncbi:hypothetical protein WDV06_36735 [Streptomyces racemochromogenes]|uniref:Uncharacterized protein n=1 Tax=Streptomyces racemochromogenes TaxID=67353 RepID=A0ABW7PQ99_9ACTN